MTVLVVEGLPVAVPARDGVQRCEGMCRWWGGSNCGRWVMETLQSSVPPGPVGPSPRVTGWTFEMVCCPLSTASVQAPNAAAAQLSWTLGKESRTKFLCYDQGIYYFCLECRQVQSL